MSCLSVVERFFKLRHGCSYSCAAVCNEFSPRSVRNLGGAMEFLGGIEEATGEEKEKVTLEEDEIEELDREFGWILTGELQGEYCSAEG